MRTTTNDDEDEDARRWESQITRDSLTQSQPFVAGLMSVVYPSIKTAIGDGSSEAKLETRLTGGDWEKIL